MGSATTTVYLFFRRSRPSSGCGLLMHVAGGSALASGLRSDLRAATSRQDAKRQLRPAGHCPKAANAGHSSAIGSGLRAKNWSRSWMRWQREASPPGARHRPPSKAPQSISSRVLAPMPMSASWSPARFCWRRERRPPRPPRPVVELPRPVDPEATLAASPPSVSAAVASTAAAAAAASLPSAASIACSTTLRSSTNSGRMA
mmetsp:Transcript_3305/g.13606  ORF Transcript_3305/g.13606 Transcript_3305/m.13606 type:complete len:202 (+) Transcript_3305:924-1529(+)